tara:strand:- start:329 stop:760 length:432 start_codon:yes stop_codon:yes gene_type:complete
MDKEKIFGLFDKDFDESLQKDLGDYKKSFHFKIGMFIKVVIYGDKWKKSVVSMFSKADTEFDVKDIDSVGDMMLYTRAWYWISQFDFDDKECLNDLKLFLDKDSETYNSSDLFISLMRTIKYFEKIEEFEKCAFLVKIRDLLK